MMYVYKNSIAEDFPFYSSVCAHPTLSSSSTSSSTSFTASSFSLNRLSFFPTPNNNNNHHHLLRNSNNNGILDIIPFKDDRIGSISFHGGLQFHTRGGLLLTEYPFQMSLLCGAAIHDRMALGGIHGFHLLDCTTGQMIQSLPTIYSTTSSQTCNITKIIPSSNHQFLYMKCDDGTLRFHDLRSSPTTAAIHVLPFSSSVSNHIQSFDINHMNSMIATSMTQTTDIHFHDVRYLSNHNNPTLCLSTNYMTHHGPAQYIQYNNDDTVCIANHVDIEILSSQQQQQQDDSSYLLQPPLLPDECITTFQSDDENNTNLLVIGTNHGTIYTFTSNKNNYTNVYSSTTSTLDVPSTNKPSSNQGVYVDATDLLKKSSSTKTASLAKYMTWTTMMNQHELFNPNNDYNFVLSSSSSYYSKHDSDPLSNYNTIVTAPNNTRILSQEFQQLMIQHNNNPQQKLKNNDDFLMTVSTNDLQTNNDTTMMIFQNYNQYIYSQRHAKKCYDIYADKRQQKQSQQSSPSNNNNNSCYSQVSIMYIL